MLEIQEIEVDGLKFQLHPMSPLEARKWDVRVVRLVAPLLGALDGAKLTEKTAEEDEEKSESEDLDISFSNVGKAIQEAFNLLSDSDMEAFLKGMFAKVIFIPDDAPSIPLTTTQAIDKALAGGNGPMTVYKLLYEVAKYNKFTPFALLGGGGATEGIAGSPLLTKMKGLALGRLGASTP